MKEWVAIDGKCLAFIPCPIPSPLTAPRVLYHSLAPIVLILRVTRAVNDIAIHRKRRVAGELVSAGRFG
jgi:hypothetical protein